VANVTSALASIVCGLHLQNLLLVDVLETPLKRRLILRKPFEMLTEAETSLEG